MLEGIDVSHHNGVVDWPKVKSAGMVFAIVKATEGVSWVDPELWDNWVGSKGAGLIRGAYHFLDAEKDAVIQAENFLDHVRLEPGDLPPILDVEQAKGETPEDLDEQALLWLRTVRRFSGHAAILYSSLNFLDKFMPSGFEDHPLWLAEYGEQVPALPNGWHDWTFWQYTQHGHVPGVAGTVDRNRFAGDLAALRGMLVG